ncbi:MAG: OmpA family protein [Candidatus Ancillula sp.]|nr:OmpA family protein [Candidatus Ancillula sp.]
MYTDVVLVVGQFSNSPQTAIDDDTKGVIGKIAKRNKITEIPVINATATPSKSSIKLLDKKQYETGNKTVLDGNFDKVLNSGIQEIQEIVPSSDGVDYLEALQKAVSNSNNKNSKQKTLILLFGSGLNDSGILNFTEDDILTKTPDEVVSKIESKSFVKNKTLSGFDVEWINLGDTIAPQIPLSGSQKSNLEAIYKSLLEKAGAGNVKIESKDKNDEEKVSVDTGGKRVKTVSSYKEGKPDYKNIHLTFDERQLGNFLPDSASLETPDKARESLASLVNMIKDESTLTVNIEGRIAKPKNSAKEDHSELALQRANYIRDLLKNMGVTNSIETTDTGSSKSTGEEIATDRKIVVTFK